LSAGGAEALAPKLASVLYGIDEKDISKMTAEQKQTISAIISLGSTAIGATSGSVTDMVASGEAGRVAVEENRQLRLDEISRIKDLSLPFAKQLYNTENPTQEQLKDAEVRLAQQSLREADKGFSLMLGSTKDQEASDFIKEKYLNEVADKYPKEEQKTFTQSSSVEILELEKIYVTAPKVDPDFYDGTTNGNQNISDLSQEDFNTLLEFYQANLHVTNSFLKEGAKNLSSAFSDEYNKNLDDMPTNIVNFSTKVVNNGIFNSIGEGAESLWNQGIINTIVDGIEGTITSTENYIQTVFGDQRINELYGQGELGSKVQANLATMDTLEAMGTATGLGGLAKVGANSIDKALDNSLDDSFDGLESITFNGSNTDPLDRRILKIGDEIDVDKSAIYGFSASEGGSLSKFGIDYSDPIQVESARQKRIPYLEKLKIKKEELDMRVIELQRQGISLEEIGRIFVEERNNNRMKSYDNNPEGLKLMKERNLKDYGREEGPTYEQVLKKENFDEKDVIESSIRTSEGFNILLGLDDEY
jgi:hypothetical protein